MTPTNFKLFFIILFHFILQYIGNRMFIHTATALSSNGRFFLPLSCILSLVSLSVFNIMSASVQFRSESFLYRRRRVPFLVYSGGDRPPAIAEAKSGDLFSSGDTVWVKNEWGWEIGVADGRAMARTRYPNFTDRVLDRTDNGYRWVASSTFRSRKHRTLNKNQTDTRSHNDNPLVLDPDLSGVQPDNRCKHSNDLPSLIWLCTIRLITLLLNVGHENARSRDGTPSVFDPEPSSGLPIRPGDRCEYLSVLFVFGFVYNFWLCTVRLTSLI
jgi:hypothetical protein